MRLCFILTATILASCSIYKTEFDCPPGKGIGCAPVHEVLNLIVERETGEDFFASDEEMASFLKEREKAKRLSKEDKKIFLLKKTSGDPVLVEKS